MIIRRATEYELISIVNLRRARAAWLATRGTDQWQVGLGTDGFEQRVKQSIGNGETWVAVDEENHLFGTIAVDQWTNPGLWSEDELSDALIIHRMITRRIDARNSGAELLRHADELASNLDKKFLRLDAWTTNQQLHRYWKKVGFHHVRTVLPHESLSTALFERRVTERSDVTAT